MNRRTFLGTSLLSMNIPLTLTLGLLRPAGAAAAWPEEAFLSNALDDALARLFGDSPLIPSAAVEIEVDDVAEDGFNVPVTLRSRIPETGSITLLSENNPTPMVARFKLSPRVAMEVNTRIKMGATGNLISVVEAQGRFYTASKRVKVTTGGCAT